jgi:hypothetical protein
MAIPSSEANFNALSCILETIQRYGFGLRRLLKTPTTVRVAAICAAITVTTSVGRPEGILRYANGSGKQRPFGDAGT